MKCRRCKKESQGEGTSPLGGIVICPECIDAVLAKVNENPIFYFGRCFRDDFRLCTQECSHIEIANPEIHEGTPKVLSASCHATSETFVNFREGVAVSESYPVTLRRRSNDEFLAALWLTRLARFLEKDDGGGDDDERPEGGASGGYREGTWE